MTATGRTTLAAALVALALGGWIALASRDTSFDPGGAATGSRQMTEADTLVRDLDFSSFAASLDTFDVARLQAIDVLTRDGDLATLRDAILAGTLTSRELTLFYLSRIRDNDPALSSVIELAPDALLEADRLDALRASGGPRGRLHGLPILLKDNIATGDGLHNTAGAAVLADHVPPRDAFVAARLREAGALILGKTNLSEWAYFMSTSAPSGYSALGGQVVNPFGDGLEVAGSSTGSAVAAVSRFAAATVGTETTGSIVAPAAFNGAAGMRPTLGLVSADLIIPVSTSLDTAGPIGRTVRDLAEMLTIMAARDGTDPNVALASGTHGTDFTDGLDDRRLGGLRIGVPTMALPAAGNPSAAVLDRVVDALEKHGATVVPVTLPDTEWRTVAALQIPLFVGSLAGDLADYLAASDASIESLDEVIAFNAADARARAPFGQDLLIRARDGALEKPARDAMAQRLRDAARTAIAIAARGGDADDPPVVDVMMSLDNTFSLLYAAAGLPAVTAPAGLDATGQPHGATFVGLEPGTDAETLAIARAFEREVGLGRAPLER